MEEKMFENESEARKYKIISICKDIVLYIILTFFALFTLIPFVWMILTAFKSTAEIQDTTVAATFFPKNWTNNFALFFGNSQYSDLWKYMGNTILVGALTTVLSVIVTVLAAFAFARLSFKGKNLIFGILLGTMMIPGEMMIITNYTTVSRWHWIQAGDWRTFLALIIPFITSVFYTFFLRQNFQQIPNELYYAAKVDGVSDFKYLLKVMIPIARPSITTVTILSMIGSWNAYIWPRTVTNSKDLSLVTNGIMEMFRNDSGLIQNNIVMAGMVLVSLPLLIAFVVFKKYIMNGVSRSGIKG